MTTLQQERAARTPAERREDFCKAYVRSGGVLGSSAQAAGFPPKSSHTRATELMQRNDVQERIAELLRERFVVEGTKAHAVVLQLSKKSTPADAVKLRAAKELMVLGGLFKKMDQAAYESSADKREQSTLIEVGKKMAAYAVGLLCLETPNSGHQTGIKFIDGVYTIVNAEEASAHLTKEHHQWTVTLPARIANTPKSMLDRGYTNPPAGSYCDPYQGKKPKDEEPEDWIAA